VLNPFGKTKVPYNLAVFLTIGSWLRIRRFRKKAAYVRFSGFEVSFCKVRLVVCRLKFTDLPGIEAELDEICATWALEAVRQNLSGAATVLRTKVIQCLMQPEVSDQTESQCAAGYERYRKAPQSQLDRLTF
jgi:hypothetical protein